ncbi:MAG: sensor histidine kinase, partial [Gemmatimonadales bacterium]
MANGVFLPAGESSALTPEMIQLPFRDRHRVLDAAAIAVALGLVLVDLSTWNELNVAVIYGLPLMLAGAARNRRLLWVLTALLIVVTFVIYALQIVPGPFTPRDPFFINRVLAVVSMLIMAALLDLWINSVRTNEARVRLIKAQIDELEAAKLSRMLVEVQESERRALANQLHDLVGQKLTALSINLHIMQTPKNSSAPTRAAQDNARLEDSLTLVEETIGSIRNVMTELSPAVLGDYGLTPALRWYAEQFTERTGVGVAVNEQGPARRLPPRTEEALFRIAQEALANIAKHAQARGVTMTLATTPRDICLGIADDGSGFDPAVPHRPVGDHGWGLKI